MIRSTLLLISVLFLYQTVLSGDKWWVFFRDKPASDNQATFVTKRALDRRVKVLSGQPLTDLLDVPVDPTYIRRVSASGARVHVASRWLNAVSVEADGPTLEAIRQLPFVRSVRRVGVARRAPEPLVPETGQKLRKDGMSADLTYGSSLMQNTTLNAVPLHALGVIGHGVLVGMIDDGFNSYRTHASLRSIPVVAAYDFIQRDTSVSVDPGEYPSQGFHGAATLSVLAGHDQGNLIGPAYGATFALAKTEVDSTEIVAEEDYYVEGIEWLDSLGVDIISSSLGYIDWYSYSQLDGQTAITTTIARLLAARGILLVTAMGNEGNYQTDGTTTGTLIAPADADSILAVGAIRPAKDVETSLGGELSSFSSTGPTADGRIKPDVVAQGSSVIVANWTITNGYFFSQGTSFSTPLTAAAAALVLSAHPEATPMQIRAALKNTALRFNDGTSRTSFFPNNFYGWGQVDAYAAALSMGPVVSNYPLVRFAVVGTEPSLIVSVRAVSNSIIDSSRFAMYARRIGDTSFVRYEMSAGPESGLYTARIPVSGPADTLYVGYLTIADQTGPELRRPAGTSLFDLAPTPDSVAGLFPPVGETIVPDDYVLEQNYPNPFNAGTSIVFYAPRQEPVELSVYNLLGEKVHTLFRGVAQPGQNSFFWPEARDERGNALATGTYVLRLSTPRSRHALKLVLLK